MGTAREKRTAPPCSQLRTAHHDCFNRMGTYSLDSALELPIRFQVRKLEWIHIAPGHRSESIQDAEKRKTMKKPLQILVLHLKSFERTYPLELKLTNTIGDAADTKYLLFGFFVHMDRVHDFGHYGCLVKSHKSQPL
ncbi:Ubiquitin carboxyl-terminal hydrolase 3-like protein, partial [Drosera capensis]